MGVRYCGGCNPRFDRTALVQTLADRLLWVDLVPARPNTPYPAAVIVCGCPAACAGRADLAVPPERMISLSAPEELPRAAERLERLLGEPDSPTP